MELKQFIQTIRDLKAKNGRQPEGFHYKSAEDFVLQNGETFNWKPVPDHIQMGRQKECFKNAFELAMMDPTLTYCEGYGLHMIPTEHAWVVDQDGNVIDNTWRDFGDEPPQYFGVKMPFDFVNDTIISQEHYGVIWGEVCANVNLMREPWRKI